MEKFNLLLVDDIEDNIYSLKMLIQDNFDLNIHSARSAKEAMETLEENTIDLILTDIQMPDINGFEFAQYLKDIEVTKDIPIIFITGLHDNEESKSKGYNIGGIEYITKPIDDVILTSKLKIYIDIFDTIKKSNNDLKNTQELLIHNSKMASVGEMVGIISHQLKQPLNVLSLYCGDIEASYTYDELSKEHINDFSKNTTDQIKYMSSTINGFLDFFNPNKKKEEFIISTSIQKSLQILKSKIDINDVKINLNLNEEIKFFGVEMEMSQIILNIVNNSIDAFVDREIKDKEIFINLDEKDSKIILTLEDNAGGVENNEIMELMEPYYSTKDNGTGIGLYMVKLLLENSLEGEVKVANSEKGLKFIIFL